MNNLLLSASLLIGLSKGYVKGGGTPQDNCDICVSNGKQCTHDMDGSCLEYVPTGLCPAGSTDCLGTDPCDRCLEIFPNGACKHNNDNTCYEKPDGNCYAGTTACLPDEPCDDAYNLFFVIDESGSIGPANYIPAINLVIDLIDNAVNSNANLGALAFGSTVDFIYSFNDIQNDNRVSIIAALEDERDNDYDGGSTNLGAALAAAINDFVNYGDPSLPNVLLLLTDGRPSSDPCSQVTALNDNDIRVIIAGIGSGFSTSAVMCLVGDSSDIFTVGGFGQTELDELEDSITEMLCPDIEPPTACENCVAAGKECLHNNDDSCLSYSQYGGCPSGSTDCIYKPPQPCRRCRDIWRPCLHAMDKTSCAKPVGGWYGNCPTGYMDCRSKW